MIIKLNGEIKTVKKIGYERYHVIGEDLTGRICPVSEITIPESLFFRPIGTKCTTLGNTIELTNN